MPINFTIDHSRRFVHARAEGEISLADIEAFSDAVMVEEAMPYRKLFDGRGAFGKYDDNDLMMLAARVSAYAAVEKRGALAIVPSPEYFELAARFIISANRTDRPVHSSIQMKPCAGSRSSRKPRETSRVLPASGAEPLSHGSAGSSQPPGRRYSMEALE